MNYKFLRLFLLLTAFFVTAIPTFAQLNQLQQQYDWVVPHASPTASVAIKLGVTDIKIDYHRPFVKGREIWGKLVPYGQVWRAGANKTTNITFGTEVMIEGQKLLAGTYGFFMLPTENEWEIIFNKHSEQWGAFTYKQSEDALRVKVKPQPAEHQEALEYTIDAASQDTAQIALRWEKIKVAFTVKADTTSLAKKKADATFNWMTAYFATNYFMDEKRDLAEALKWANVGVMLQESFSTYYLKARVLAEMGRYKDAVETAEKGLEISKTAKNPIPPAQMTFIEKTMAEWKSKM